MRPRVRVLVNPTAGSHTQTASDAADALWTAGVEPEVRQAEGARLCGAARQAMTDGVRTIVAAGGDGTISTIASALVGSGFRLGVLPLGTLNHFAKDLGVPSDLEGAARTIADAHTAAIDIGEVNGHVFLNNSGVGVYPHLVAERRRQRADHHVPMLSDIPAAWTVLRDYRRLHVTVTTEGVTRTVCTPFVFVGNNAYELEGFNFGARRRLDAGQLQVCLAPDIGRASFVYLVALALVGRLNDHGRFQSMMRTECAINAGRRQVLVSVDGEVILLQTPLHYRIRPQALQVIVPAQLRPSL